MGFIISRDETSDTTQQKIRISLSKRASIVISDDMHVFSVSKRTSFINLIITNFRDDAKATLSVYLMKKKHEIEHQLFGLSLDAATHSRVIEHLLANERKKTEALLKEYMKEKYESKLYHINRDNISFLADECEDQDFFNSKASSYLKCLLEEYASLPFPSRERIARKDVYDVVEQAIKTKSLLKVSVPVNHKQQTFLVYPYKIITDPLGTQDYLACYTQKDTEYARDKTDASFSMARLPKPTKLSQQAFLSKKDVAKLKEDINRLSVPFLLGTPEEIHVKLTDQGKASYLSKMYSRPEKDENASTDDIYVFHCTETQAYSYFFSFGHNATILSPDSLKEKMKRNYERALQNYITD